MVATDDSWENALRERLSVRRWLESRMPSAFITHAVATLKAGARVLLVLRVSINAQKAHLDDQEKQLRAAAEANGWVVCGVIRRIGRGNDCVDDGELWSDWIAFVASEAQKHNATVLATESNRILRSYSEVVKRGVQIEIEASDLRIFKQLTSPVSFATLLQPDATVGETRSVQIRRGQAKGGNSHGGRPRLKTSKSTKRRRDRYRLDVLRLKAAGKSYRDICKLVPVPLTTLHRWCNSAK